VIPYTATDYKKFVYAQAVNRMRRIEDIIDALDVTDSFENFEALNDLGYQFDTLHDWLRRAAFCDDHRQAEAQEAQNTYIDGRTVATTFKFGDRKCDWVTHVWHPDPLHPDNRPGAMIEFCQEPYPWSYRYLVVTAPGIIDVVEEQAILGEDEEE
jgi:hypothetical protein